MTMERGEYLGITVRDILPYEYKDDRYVEVSDNGIVLGEDGLSIDITAMTKAGDETGGRENEDAFRVIQSGSDLYILVADGVSSQISYPTLETTGARHASKHLAVQMPSIISCAMNEDDRRAENVMLELNRSLRKNTIRLMENEAQRDDGAKINFEKPSTLPSSTGTLVRVNRESNTLDIAHVGDSWVIVEYTDGKYDILSLDTNLVHDAETMHKIDQWRGTDEDKITFKQAVDQNLGTDDAGQDKPLTAHLKKSFDRKNNPNNDPMGTGIINGVEDEIFKQYLIHDSINLDRVKAVLIGTDGMVPIGLSENNRLDQQKIFEIIKEKGLAGLISTNKKNNIDDPHHNQYPRIKGIDDATAVYLEFHK